jgi:uncharacterized protein
VATRTDIFDLGRLGLTSGEGRRLDLTVAIDPLEFGGQRYEAAPADVPAKLDVSRTTGNGWFLRLRFDARLSGPCMRCLEDAGRGDAITVDSREVDQPGAEDEDLNSPYVEGDELDVHAWARDALVLELPTQIVCSEDCKGLCAVCGENLNTAAADHAHEPEPDPRWAKLSELKLELDG